MAKPEYHGETTQGTEGECPTCQDSKWTNYTSILPDGTAETAMQLCWCNGTDEPAAEKPEKATDPQAARAHRGIELYVERHDEFERTGEAFWRIPSCSGRMAYAVDVGWGRECCSCRDYQTRNEPCKHIFGALIAEAKTPTFRVVPIDADVYGARRYEIVEYRAQRPYRRHGALSSLSDAYFEKWALEERVA